MHPACYQHARLLLLQASPPGKDVVPLIKAKPSAGVGAGVSIPDCMKLQPSEQERQYERYKSSLVEALKPTPDMVAKVSTNEQLMAGERLLSELQNELGDAMPCVSLLPVHLRHGPGWRHRMLEQAHTTCTHRMHAKIMCACVLCAEDCA